MADDRLVPFLRLALISSINSDGVIRHRRAISRNPFQKASSRLTLVRWPPMATERFTIVDCMNVPRPREPGAILKGLFWRLVYGGLADCLRQKKNPRLLPGAPTVRVAVSGIGARGSVKISRGNRQSEPKGSG